MDEKMLLEKFLKATSPWQEYLVGIIEEAIGEALPNGQYSLLKREQNQALEFWKATQERKHIRTFLGIEDILEKSRIGVHALPEYRFVLEYLGYNQEEIIKTLAHENAHANTALHLGADRTVYCLDLSRPENGVGMPLIGHPFVRVFYPSHWYAEEKEAVEKQVIMAPEKYGCRLSESDKLQLGLFIS